MGMMFGMLGKKPMRAKTTGKPKRFTRFADAGAIASADGDKKFSRFAPKAIAPTHDSVSPAPETGAQLAATKLRADAELAAVKLNPAEHLESEAQIPVSILRKALPKRFSEMPEESLIANLS